jgi:hypothetical protein
VVVYCNQKLAEQVVLDLMLETPEKVDYCHDKASV